MDIAPCGWVLDKQVGGPGVIADGQCAVDPSKQSTPPNLMSSYNCLSGQHCGRGSAQPVLSATPECANVGTDIVGAGSVNGTTLPPTRTSDPALRRCPDSDVDEGEQVGELQAGACVEWRYITADSSWVMVKDRQPHDSRDSWVFIDRRAISPNRRDLNNINVDHNVYGKDDPDHLKPPIRQAKYPQYPDGVCPSPGTGVPFTDGTQ